MFQCHVCGSCHAHEESINEVFQVDGRAILVKNVPAVVCDRCGEFLFSRETTEKVRNLIHGEQIPVSAIMMDVYAL
ncbi:MAG: YgiT-type zinc finger protein [Candidatus Omnitrophota bacterium]|jgi:YgiT-type zinc finger domain-containing protein|nr:MAG: YgiT-type zinc finger protein [Candidatus Omnitrophota bacterium]